MELLKFNILVWWNDLSEEYRRALTNLYFKGENWNNIDALTGLKDEEIINIYHSIKIDKVITWDNIFNEYHKYANSLKTQNERFSKKSTLKSWLKRNYETPKKII